MLGRAVRLLGRWILVLALVQILMLLDVAHSLQGFLPSLNFARRNHAKICLFVGLFLWLPSVVLERSNLLIELLLCASLLLSRDPEYAPILAGALFRLAHFSPVDISFRTHDDSFLAENRLLFLQKLVNFVLPSVAWLLMVELHEVFLELFDGLLLLDLHSHIFFELSTGLYHSHMCLDSYDLFQVSLIILLLVHLQDTLKEILHNSRFLVQDSLLDEAPETEDSILTQNLHHSPPHSLFDASARFNALIVFDQTAKLSPIELHASRPAHSLPLLFQVSPHCPLNQRGFLGDLFEMYPFL